MNLLLERKQIPRIVVTIRNSRKPIDRLEPISLPWAQGIGRTIRRSPHPYSLRLQPLLTAGGVDFGQDGLDVVLCVASGFDVLMLLHNRFLRVRSGRKFKVRLGGNCQKPSDIAGRWQRLRVNRSLRSIRDNRPAVSLPVAAAWRAWSGNRRGAQPTLAGRERPSHPHLWRSMASV